MPDFIPYSKNNMSYVLQLIGSAIYTPVDSLEVTAWRTTEPVVFSERCSGIELSLKPGDKWGDLFDCAWFHFNGNVPEKAAGQPVALVLDVNGEMLVFDSNGQPVRGLTNGSSVYDFSLGKPGKRILPVIQCAQGGEVIDVWADAGCNDLFGNLQENGTLQEACIAIVNEDLRGLYYDFEVLLDFLNVLPTDSPRYQQILTALNRAAWSLAHGLSDEQARAARAQLRPVLEKRCGDPSLMISAVGHAHIDLAWLWPLRETRRKGARTFATVMRNMERYPNYIFGASQPQLFQWIKEDHPALYKQIKQRAAEGRFEPQGAMWVEADTNVSGGEALVRQVLLGKRFFQQEFGVDMKYLWLPDVFGYSAALPQILKKAGVDYFMTQKMSWNQVNTFPHHSFYWQGIDGSRVLSHMLPEETYNSSAAPRAIHKIETNYHDIGVSEHCMLLFGIGDGGGGPGEEHLERLERIKNMAGLSPVKQETAVKFFEQWVKDAARFPSWVGELYLERHSGTLTTEAKNKWFNRHMEQSLRELEWTSIIDNLIGGGNYPAKRLETIWQEVLLYQFHDILPGSSIKRVYDESIARYSTLYEEVNSLICTVEQRIAGLFNTASMTAPVVFFNSLSWPRREWAQANGQWKQVTVPGSGIAAIDMSASDLMPSLQASTTLLENDLLRVRFDEHGTVNSVFDKTAAREALTDGRPGNRLAVYRDPGDAWDFPLDYANQKPMLMQLVSSKARIDGPRAVLEQVYRFGYSQLAQEVVLTAGSRRIDFHTRVHWRERESMLRTSFAVAVHAEEAAFDIQFGHVRRPTHTNTSWDLAKDEVAAHKWVDLSQRDYGVALLNDSKYGHRVKGNVIDLNLLRSVPYPGYNMQRDLPIAPGEAHPGFTDQTDHVFSYALYPHSGDLVNGGVVQAGYEFNYPLQQAAVAPAEGPINGEWSLLSIDSPNILVEAVKKAEDDDGVIVRLYETTHAGTTTTLSFGFPVTQVQETDLMEQPIKLLELDDDAVILGFQPFEIKTLKIV